MNIGDMIIPGIKDVKPSGIRKYFDLINEMKGAISLGIGEPDFVTPWNIREAGIYSIEKGHTHYSQNSGYIELREEICKYVQRKYGLTYSPTNQTLVTVGGSEAIDIALRALVGPGDEVIVPEPCFVSYRACVEFTGATAVSIDLKMENNFKLTPQELEEKITPKTKVVIIAFPNNPTGAVLNRKDLDGIVQVLKDKDIIVISDEIYSELNYEENHISIASYPEMYEKIIVINGFSKAFAMTGWRLGYALGHPDLINAMFKIHQYAIMCAPSLAQHAAIEALQNGDYEVSEMVKEYNRRRLVAYAGFNKARLECFEPKGAFYVFPCIKSSGMTSDEFCEKLLIEEKVLVVPGTAFGDCGEGYVRATYANSMENIIEAMNRIQRFMKNIKG